MDTKRRPLRRFVAVVSVLAIILAVLVGIKVYSLIFHSNVKLLEERRIYIQPEADFEQLMDSLRLYDVLKDEQSFRLTAKKMSYPDYVKPGSYIIRPGMSNRDLLVKLRAGDEDPVIVVFNTLDGLEELAGVISPQLQFDSVDLLQFIRSEVFIEDFNLDGEEMTTRFIPNSYEMYWSASPKEFCHRMIREYQAFWNGERKAKLKRTGLNQQEVIVLASIIEKEYRYADELPMMAGLYINRLNKGMYLQADPTVKYAVGDLSIKRVLKVHLEMDSPYNTYRYKGLPPGPICLPSITAIDAVLNYRKHDYLYFCAKDDLSGYHTFSKTYAQHVQNARAYHRALNKLKIY